MERIEIISKLIFISFMAACAIQDKKEREVENRVYLLFSISGIVLGMVLKRAWTEVIPAFIPGIILVLTAKITNEAFGMGDALFYLVSAMYIDIKGILAMLFVSIFICGIMALFIIACSGMSVRGRREITIPYLTVVFPVGVITLFL